MRIYKKQPYTTEQSYGVDKPAGSKVLATKDYQGVLLLEYEDGSNVKILNGWCRGLEENPNVSKGLWEQLSENCQRDLDQEILFEIETAIKEMNFVEGKDDEQARNELPEPPGTDS